MSEKNKDAATAIFFINQAKDDTTLLDGIGVNGQNVVNFIVESSGYVAYISLISNDTLIN